MEFRDLLISIGVPAERGQQHKGGPGSPDVVQVLPCHFEVKFTNRFDMWPAIEQAQEECGGLPWVVVTRRTSGPLNRRKWVAVVDAAWLVRLIKTSDPYGRGHCGKAEDF